MRLHSAHHTANGVGVVEHRNHGDRLKHPN